jgi:hypothetical protein
VHNYPCIPAQPDSFGDPVEAGNPSTVDVLLATASPPKLRQHPLVNQAMTASPERQVELRRKFDGIMRQIDKIRFRNQN